MEHPTETEIDTFATIDYTRNHFDNNFAACRCQPKCVIDDLYEIAKSFANMNESDRVNAIRFMLFSTTSPSSEVNQMSDCINQCANSKRNLHSPCYVKPVYAIKGRRLCRFSFAAVVQMNTKVISEHALEISNSDVIENYDTQACKRRKGRPSPHTIIVITFLDWYAGENGFENPTGRGSSAEIPLVLLPSDTNKDAVYKLYYEKWEEMMNYLMEDRLHNNMVKLSYSSPLSFKSFYKVWYNCRKTIKIMAPGSDYCDTCTQIRYCIEICNDIFIKEELETKLKEHKEEAASEFSYYRQLQNDAKSGSQPHRLHIIFDFAEKVLIPHLLRQPGQLHFVTGLKIDLFGIHISNAGMTDIYGLVEGHWTGGNC